MRGEPKLSGIAAQLFLAVRIFWPYAVIGTWRKVSAPQKLGQLCRGEGDMPATRLASPGLTQSGDSLLKTLIGQIVENFDEWVEVIRAGSPKK
jgi:hypothetical protein